MKNFETGIWPGSKVEKDKSKEVKMEDFDNFREYLKAKVRKERADAKEALEKGIMGMSRYSGWVERVESVR